MIRKVFSTIFILLGLVVLIYPKGSEKYYDYQQQKVMENWQEDLMKIESTDDINNDQEEISKKDKELYLQDHMEGILNIDKIGLEMPILNGASKNNLKVAVSSIKGTGKPGEIGNYSIAGHRNRSFGSHFNRLDEIEKGDSIKVKTEKDNYNYIVSEKLLVKPEEVQVLKGNDTDREITLVTCHPMVNNPPYRLIIKGKIMQ